ncbi:MULTISPECIES: hypothetical protein [unclassified Ruegeria]|uniref:hypothetical protein n=1 Tax=unclassified Ruegeria TaxID=2625375 RepID=UPI001487FCA1|nr:MULTISPECIES: hypothetical protein [unclassified Ruegeria]
MTHAASTIPPLFQGRIAHAVEDRLGRKYLMWALIGFTVASAIYVLFGGGTHS